MPFLFLTAALTFLLSFLSKLAADAWLHARIPLIGTFAGLQPSRNPGIVFGLRLPQAWQTPLIAMALLLVAVAAVRTAKTRVTRLGFGLILGGALANLADRLFDGFVTDFFQVGAFPVFNVADSCITIGVAVLLLESAGVIREQKRC